MTRMGKHPTTLAGALTVPEVCALLRTTRLTVYNLIESGALPAYKVGPYWRIDVDDFERYRARGKAQDPANRRRLPSTPAGEDEPDPSDGAGTEGGTK